MENLICTIYQWKNRNSIKDVMIMCFDYSNERRSQKFSNNRTISLISHTSKILLRIILNRLIPQAEDILPEEKTVFRTNRSTTEQIHNCRLIMEKHIDQ